MVGIENGPGNYVPVLWAPGGKSYTQLPNGGGSSSISNNGEYVSSDAFHTYLYAPGSTTPSVTVTGSLGGYSQALNDRGQFVFSQAAQYDGYAYLWDNGVITNINNLLPASQFSNGPGNVVVTGINNRGDIIGYVGPQGFEIVPDATPSLVRNSNFSTGNLVGWTPSGAGASVVQTNGKYAASLTVDDAVDLSQYVDLPSNPSNVEFDYQFQTLTGTLAVTLNGTVIDVITAPATLAADFEHESVAIPADLLGATSVDLDFGMSGAEGSQVDVTDVTTPEPGSLALLTIASIAVMGRRRLNCRRSSRTVCIR
jgi:hypothetical protein